MIFFGSLEAQSVENLLSTALSAPRIELRTIDLGVVLRANVEHLGGYAALFASQNKGYLYLGIRRIIYQRSPETA